MLEQNGGVFVDNRATLVQPLDQVLKEIPYSQDINQGQIIFEKDQKNLSQGKSNTS